MAESELTGLHVLPPIMPIEACQTDESVHQEETRTGMRDWLAKRRGWLIGAGFVASAGIALLPGSADDTISDLKEVTPWVLPGMITAEAAWIGGAAMVVASAGKNNMAEALKHPIQTKNQFADIARDASDTMRFKVGFGLNAAGAVAEFVIPAVAVTTHLPPESWGILSLSAADLVLTIATRKAILTAVKENKHLDTDCSEQ